MQGAGGSACSLGFPPPPVPRRTPSQPHPPLRSMLGGEAGRAHQAAAELEEEQ